MEHNVVPESYMAIFICLSRLADAIRFAFTAPATRKTAALYALGLFLLLGIPTALLSNPLIPYVRMVEATPLDYAFLFATSILAAVYITLPPGKTCPFGMEDKSAFGGGALGFLSFSCPICNHVLLLLLGYGTVFGVIEPLRPFFGILAVLLFSYAICKKWKCTNQRN